LKSVLGRRMKSLYSPSKEPKWLCICKEKKRLCWWNKPHYLALFSLSCKCGQIMWARNIISSMGHMVITSTLKHFC
jgi:hypothetical protein